MSIFKHRSYFFRTPVTICLFTCTIVSVVLYQQVPDQIPVHFNLSGVPDRWEARTPFSWFLLNGIGILLTLFLYAITLFIRSKPELINIPDKQRFLLLPPEKQDAVFKELDLLLGRTTGIMLILFTVIQWGSVQVATGKAPTLPPLVLIAIFGTSTIIFVFVAIHLNTISKLIKAKD